MRVKDNFPLRVTCQSPARDVFQLKLLIDPIKLYRLNYDLGPAGSLHSFKLGQILNPYPTHYKWAFAFSNILYPLTQGLTLQFACQRVVAGNWAYQVPVFVQNSYLGSVYSTVALQ